MRKYLMLTFLFIWASPIFAVEPLILSDDKQEYPLWPHVEALQDKSGKLTLEEVRKIYDPERWKSYGGKIPGFGISTGVTYWIRFKIDVQSHQNQKWLLNTNHAIINSIDLMQLQENKIDFRISTGRRHAISQRPFPHRFFVLPLPERIEKNNCLYVRVDFWHGVSSFPFKVISEKQHLKNDHNEQIYYGLFFGFLIIMVMYNLFLFLILKDANYLLYVLYVFFIGLANADGLGFASEYLWPDNFALRMQFTQLWMVVGLFWAALFMKKFLLLKKHSPFLDRFLSGVLIYILALIILFFSVDVGFAGKLIAPSFALLLPANLLIAGFIAWKGYRPARFFLVGWSALIAGTLIVVLKNIDFFPDIAVVRESARIGIALEVMLFSIALGDRYNLMRAEKEAAEREKLESRIRMLDAAARFVPRQFLHFLGHESLEDVKLGDSIQKRMAILFSDIRDFTSLSETMSPEDNFKFMNAYLGRMEPFVHQHGGFIDKYIGDAVMALFPGGGPDAVQAAIGMARKIDEYNRERRAYGYVPIKAGMGIHAGDLMLGTIGGESRMDSTVIADAVNLSARLEGLTKLFSARVLVSGVVLNECQDQFRSRHLGRVQVKGKSGAVDVFEILDADPDALSEKKLATKVDFERAIGLYQNRNFVDAGKLFAAVIAASSDDPVAALYLKRCEAFIADPPPDDWDGTEVMEGK